MQSHASNCAVSIDLSILCSGIYMTFPESKQWGANRENELQSVLHTLLCVLVIAGCKSNPVKPLPDDKKIGIVLMHGKGGTLTTKSSYPQHAWCRCCDRHANDALVTQPNLCKEL